MYKILFSHDDIELCKKKIGKQNQLAFAIMFGYYRSWPNLQERAIPVLRLLEGNKTGGLLIL
jgi:hypothetical protein